MTELFWQAESNMPQPSKTKTSGDKCLYVGEHLARDGRFQTLRKDSPRQGRVSASRPDTQLKRVTPGLWSGVELPLEQGKTGQGRAWHMMPVERESELFSTLLLYMTFAWGKTTACPASQAPSLEARA